MWILRARREPEREKTAEETPSTSEEAKETPEGEPRRIASERLFALSRAALSQGPGTLAALDRVRDQVQPADAEAASAVLAAARALAQPGEAGTHLAAALSYWRMSPLLTRISESDQALAGGSASVTAPPHLNGGCPAEPSSALPAVLQVLADADRDPAEAFAAMTVRALADGARPAVVTEVEDVVAAGEHGGTRLMVAVMDGGPPGLHPDPERMALLRPTEEFASAVRDAWMGCSLAAQGRSVLWAAEGVDGEPLSSADGDFGRAFVSVLADADARFGDTDDRLWRRGLTLPWLRRDLAQRRPLLVGLVAMVTAIALVLGTADLMGRHSGEDRSAVAARLSARALGVAEQNPKMAAQLALAAYRLAPTDQTAGLLRQISEDDPYVARRFDSGTGELDALALDDGRQMAFTAGPDGGVRAWSAWAGTFLGRVSGQSDIVALACDPVAPLLAGADSKGDVLLWKTGDISHMGKPVRLHMPYLGGTEGQTVGLGFSHDGTRVYRIAGNGEVRVWDTRTHAELNRVNDSLGAKGHQVVNPVAASDPYTTGSTDASESVLIGTDDDGIVSYNLRTDRTTNLLSAGQARGPITALAADASTGTLTVAAGSPAGLSLWSMGTGHHENYPYAGITASVSALSHRADDTLAVGTDQGVDLVDAEGGMTTSRPQGGYAGQFGSSTTSEGRYLVVGGTGDTVTVLDARGAGLAPATGEASTVLAYDARGDLLLNDLDGNNWATGLYMVHPNPENPARGESTTRSRRAFLPGADWWPKGSRFYANAGALTSSFAAVAGQDPDNRAVVLVWDARTGKALRHIVFPGDSSTFTTDSDLPPNIAVSVLFDTRLHLMVARDSSGQVAAWSTRTWRQTLRVSTGVVGGGGMALSPDGRSALLTVGSGRANDVATKNRLVTVDLRTRRVDSVALDRWAYEVAYAPGSSRVAALSTDGTVTFLNRAGRRLPDAPVIRLPVPATGIAYSPNGRYLAVGGLGKALVYRTADGQLAYPAFDLPDGQSAVEVAWDPSGTLLTATAGMLGDHPRAATTYFWPLTHGRWLSRVCALAGGDLTRTAWAESIGSSVPYRTLCGGHDD